MSKKVTIELDFDIDTYNKIVQLSIDRKISKNKLINNLLKDYLKKQTEK